MIILICAIKDILILLDKCILEPIVSKGTRWVLRRGKESNLLVLSDDELLESITTYDEMEVPQSVRDNLRNYQENRYS